MRSNSGKIGPYVFLAGLVITSGCAYDRSMVPPPLIHGAAAPTPAAVPKAETAVVRREPAIAAMANRGASSDTSRLATNVLELDTTGYPNDVFFDTDKAELRTDARDVLVADAAWLRQHPAVKVQIEGHCDERNTEAYNLALGWRRAHAVKAYLTSLGVADDQIATISYGEERPFATCPNESCWWQNRRAHFVVTAR